MRDAVNVYEDRIGEALVIRQLNPMKALKDLELFTAGCQWLIDRWEDLLHKLDQPEKWSLEDIQEAIYLQGFVPEIMTLGGCTMGWKTYFFGLLCRDDPDWDTVKALREPPCVPYALRDRYAGDKLPSPKFCCDWLAEIIAQRLSKLRRLEASMRAVQTNTPAEIAARSMILNDPDDARIFLRYHTEARNAFVRNFTLLEKTLKQDAACGLNDDPPAETTPEIAPEPSPPPPPEADSPNEPSNGATVDDEETLAMIQALRNAGEGGIVTITIGAKREEGVESQEEGRPDPERDPGKGR
jgi:hypothetical protein